MSEEIGRKWLRECLPNQLIDNFSIRDISPQTFASDSKRIAAAFITACDVANARSFASAVLEAAGKEARRDADKNGISDDHFTWWFDDLLATPNSGNMSMYEVASLAWHEAVHRTKAQHV